MPLRADKSAHKQIFFWWVCIMTNYFYAYLTFLYKINNLFMKFMNKIRKI